MTDSIWMITPGTTGLVGLASQTLLFLLPSVSLFRQFRKIKAIESVPENTIVLAGAVVLGLPLVDVHLPKNAAASEALSSGPSLETISSLYRY